MSADAAVAAVVLAVIPVLYMQAASLPGRLALAAMVAKAAQAVTVAFSFITEVVLYEDNQY